MILANSKFIAQRVQTFYGRNSRVVYPFADLGRFRGERKAGQHYLMVGAFAPYKKIDIAIAAFNQLKLPLLIVGSGQDERRLKKKAGPTVEFLGALSNRAIADLYSKCKAFVFPGIEDFGITPVEAMASGTPVIAFGQGGAAETVTEKTGLFFHSPTVESLSEAILKFEKSQTQFTEKNCRQRAAFFSRERFQKEFLEQVTQAWVKRGKDPQLLPGIRPESSLPNEVFADSAPNESV